MSSLVAAVLSFCVTSRDGTVAIVTADTLGAHGARLVAAGDSIASVVQVDAAPVAARAPFALPVAMAPALASAPANETRAVAAAPPVFGIERKRAVWEKRPTVEDACASLAHRIQGEARVSVPCTLNGTFAGAHATERVGELTRARIAVTRDRKLAIEGREGRYVLRDVALRQLLARCDVASGAAFLFDLERKGMGDTVAAVCNRVLAAKLGGDVVLRLRTRASGESEAFALVTDDYTEHDGNRIARVLSTALAGAGMRARVDYSEDACSWRIEATAQSTKADIAKGDAFHVGTVLRGKDDGTGAIRGSDFCERVACLNGMLLRAVGGEWSVTHSSDERKIVAAIRKGIAHARDSFAEFLETWTAASADRVLQSARDFDASVPITIEQAIPGFYAALLKENRELLRVTPNKANADAVMHAWQREPGDTRAAVVNGLTRWAHETAGPWAVDNAASVAARLLSDKRPLRWMAPEGAS